MVVMLLPPALRAQSFSSYLQWTYQDAREMLGNIDGHTIKLGLLGTAVVAALSPLDRPVHDRAIRGFSKPVRYYAEAGNFIGEVHVAVPSALGIWGISMLTDNTRFKDAAFTSAQSLLYASTATMALKLILGRSRPADVDSPFKFAPFSGAYAFPSGHTTAAFALLVPWLAYYPGPFTWSLVAVAAGGTAFGRIEHNRHWLTDVVAGGIIGTSAALLLSRRHINARNGTSQTSAKLLFYPISTAYQQGIQVEIHLN